MTPKELIIKNALGEDLVFLPSQYDHALIGITAYFETVYNAIEVQNILLDELDGCEESIDDVFEDMVEEYVSDCVFIYIPYVS